VCAERASNLLNGAADTKSGAIIGASGSAATNTSVTGEAFALAGLPIAEALVGTFHVVVSFVFGIVRSLVLRPALPRISRWEVGRMIMPFNGVGVDLGVEAIAVGIYIAIRWGHDPSIVRWTDSQGAIVALPVVVTRAFVVLPAGAAAAAGVRAVRVCSSREYCGGDGELGE